MTNDFIVLRQTATKHKAWDLIQIQQIGNIGSKLQFLENDLINIRRIMHMMVLYL